MTRRRTRLGDEIRGPQTDLDEWLRLSDDERLALLRRTEAERNSAQAASRILQKQLNEYRQQARQVENVEAEHVSA